MFTKDIISKSLMTYSMVQNIHTDVVYIYNIYYIIILCRILNIIILTAFILIFLLGFKIYYNILTIREE